MIECLLFRRKMIIVLPRNFFPNSFSTISIFRIFNFTQMCLALLKCILSLKSIFTEKENFVRILRIFGYQKCVSASENICIRYFFNTATAYRKTRRIQFVRMNNLHYLRFDGALPVRSIQTLPLYVVGISSVVGQFMFPSFCGVFYYFICDGWWTIVYGTVYNVGFFN